MKSSRLLALVFVLLSIGLIADEKQTLKVDGNEVEIVRGDILYILDEAYTHEDVRKWMKGSYLATEATLTENMVKNLSQYGKIHLGSEKYDIEIVKHDMSVLPYFTYVGFNFVGKTVAVPNDPDIDDQYALATMECDLAWEITKGSANVIVGIIDSGIPMTNGVLSHPDLDESSRYILGINPLDPTGQTPVRDDYGHGTFVLGVFGAETDNGTGIAGVNWNSKAIIEKAFNSTGSGYSEDILSATMDAINRGADIVNMSFVFTVQNDEYLVRCMDSCLAYDVLVVAGMGNGGDDDMLYPAGYSSTYSNVVAVGGTQSNGSWWDDSSYGNHIDVCAPASSIYSTMPDYAVTGNNSPPSGEGLDQDYDYWNGTSFSTPYVVGVASLVKSVYPNMTASQIKQQLIDYADDMNYSSTIGVGWDQRTGWGQVNAYKSLTGQQYQKTYLSSSSISGVQVGDVMDYYIFIDTFPIHVGSQTVTFDMITSYGLYVWNGEFDDGTKHNVTGVHLYRKNNGSYLQFVVYPDAVGPSILTYEIEDDDRIHVKYDDTYSRVAALSVFIFDSNESFLYSDVLSMPIDGNQDYFIDLNSTLSNGDIVKIAVRDRAGNTTFATEDYIYTPPQPLSVSISGPGFLPIGQTGTFTANVTGGEPPYSHYYWYQRNNGMIGARTTNENEGGGTIGLPVGRWSEIIGFRGLTSVSYKSQYESTSLKCVVWDNVGTEVEDIFTFVSGLPKPVSGKLFPEELSLVNNYPNPFNPSTLISYGVPTTAEVSIKIFDIEGRKVATLLNGNQAAGWQSIMWNGKDHSGRDVGSGIYIVKLVSQKRYDSMKVLLAR